jgi:hypothetical protein
VYSVHLNLLKLTEEQLDCLAERIPDHEPGRKGRRQAADKRNVTQDGHPLRRYKRRWTVERTIDILQQPDGQKSRRHPQYPRASEGFQR